MVPPGPSGSQAFLASLLFQAMTRPCHNVMIDSDTVLLILHSISIQRLMEIVSLCAQM